jgi:diacylglycerol O-acyltransferase / wax synthase
VEHFNYERLSAQDNDFLLWETPALPMHGSGLSLFDAGPLATPDGGIDFAAVQRAFAAVLHRVPRYRQQLMWPAGDTRAVWVDDPHFRIDYHVRHIALPRPGSDAQLKRLAADVMERPLDRGRPLWECWLIEGLEGGRFAILNKTHHCMIDGASGMALMQTLYSAAPDAPVREAPRYVPRPPPSALELQRDAWRRRLGLPGRLLAEGRRLLEDGRVADELAGSARALAQLARFKLKPASETPLNGPIGPHRIFDWLELPLEAVRAVRRARGCSLNDVVLATVAGAVRDFLIGRQLRPERLDFRVSAPVNVRRGGDPDRLGNHVSSWIVPLPLGEADPLAQLRAIHTTTAALKQSNQAAGVELVTRLHEVLPIDVHGLSRGTQNLLVTNVAGPQLPLYLLGARLRSLFVQPPLLDHVGLAISAVSYDGKLGFGLTGDRDRVPDLADFGRDVARAFERLASAAGVAPAVSPGCAA